MRLAEMEANTRGESWGLGRGGWSGGGGGWSLEGV